MITTLDGVKKMHQQLWHMSSKQMFERISTVVAKDKHGELRKLCDKAVSQCKVCRMHKPPGHAPKLGGIWANNPGDIVAGDTFFLKIKNKKYKS